MKYISAIIFAIAIVIAIVNTNLVKSANIADHNLVMHTIDELLIVGHREVTSCFSA